MTNKSTAVPITSYKEAVRCCNNALLDLKAQLQALMNKGMDKMLWNYLHDGLKIACMNMFKEQVDKRVAKMGLSEDMREKMYDEAGQLVNDTFGGQFWELINVSPATVKWMQRALLSPDWLTSTQRTP